MPDMDLASVACAIQNMWLLARAEGIGLGWVSLFDPMELAHLLDMPDGARPVAMLCIGRAREFLPHRCWKSKAGELGGRSTKCWA